MSKLNEQIQKKAYEIRDWLAQKAVSCQVQCRDDVGILSGVKGNRAFAIFVFLRPYSATVSIH